MALEISRLIFPKKFTNRFPTKLETLRAFLFEKQKYLKVNLKPSNEVIADVVVKKIQKIYAEAGVKTLRKDIIAGKVMKTYKSRLDLLKFSRSQRYTKPFLIKKQKFESVMSEILQVTDKEKIKRKNNTQKKSNITQQVITDIDFSDCSDVGETDDKKDQDYEPPSDVTSFAGDIRKRDLTEIVEVQSRFSYSERGTAAIVNATLKTFNIPVIIDKSMLQRAQKRTFKEMKETSIDFGGGLYYDSRKDETITQTEKRSESGKSKFYRSLVRQEHYSLVSQPNNLFMGFVNTKDGTAEIGSKTILKFIKDKNITNDIIALGSDGANTNVGGTGGINYFIEADLKRPVHWFICMLHANELPLKALITKLDGKTTGRNSFSGPIGKAIEKIGRPTIVDFQPFKGSKKLEEMPVDVYKKLSNDQKYLYRIVNALITREFANDLMQLKVGNLCHSRWITTASRICLLYASSKNPSDTLKIITSYIVDVYAPTWFQIKKNELAVNGPKNLFFLIERSNLIVDNKAKMIVRKCIRRNAFFAHSENMLLAQLASSEMSIRNDGVIKILEIRDRIHNAGVRIFNVPNINFNAKTWTEILIWNSPEMTEPPLTLKMTERELLTLIKRPLKVPLFKCHTQMVERAVKEVTRVSVKATSQQKQESLVKATLINRAKYPKFDSKKDHIVQSHGNFQPKI